MSTLADRGRRLLAEGKLAGAVPLFGAPMALGMALYTAFNFVDLWMIGQLGDASAALAALGVCDNVAAVAPIVAHGLSTGAVTLLSFALGRDDAASLRRIAWSSLGLVGVLGVFFGLAGLGGSEWIVRDLMRAKGAAAEEAVPYLQIQLGGSLAIFLLLQVTAILRALGSSVTAAALLVSGNLLNLALNAVAI
ncbi:MAG: MATE family efflux transporter, partial [Polyangiales bacterium]